MTSCKMVLNLEYHPSKLFGNSWEYSSLGSGADFNEQESGMQNFLKCVK